MTEHQPETVSIKYYLLYGARLEAVYKVIRAGKWSFRHDFHYRNVGSSVLWSNFDYAMVDRLRKIRELLLIKQEPWK